MPKKHFQDSKGRRIERIANETQLKQYLQGSWAEKSLGIAIEPGLRINHATHAWDLLFERNKCRTHRTLGKYPKVSLKEAVEKARECKVVVNPRKQTSSVQSSLETQLLIDDVIEEYFQYRYKSLCERRSNKDPYKSVERMRYQYAKFIRPVIGNLPISMIKTSHVIAVLSPITASETTRSKTKAVLSKLVQWLVFSGKVDVDLMQIDWFLVNRALPPCSNIERHYARLGYDRIPELVEDIFLRLNIEKERDYVSSLALLLQLLTAQRAGGFLAFDRAIIGEGRMWFSTWSNVNFEDKIWTIPPNCLKVTIIRNQYAQPLKIPLAEETIIVLKLIKKFWKERRGINLAPIDFVVPKYDDLTRAHCSHCLRLLLKQMHRESLQRGGIGYHDPDQPGRIITPHGFRSTFEDWCLSRGFSLIDVNKALAHIGNKVQEAYQREALLKTRRPMMDAWAKFCFSKVDPTVLARFAQSVAGY
ncbi:tyrosine-type recombinase/integrase [Parasutterella secunda]|uniref:Tyr recombinase domain-containing protein n=1 Tax=Parasutterella secunda TaxID=626947 RepID=A0ABS2GRV2_9BURK|nr:hypothetical protein [Parasutterella secunda]MBM6928525.1 hypothetical protein [Parasutterella secunda]